MMAAIKLRSAASFSSELGREEMRLISVLYLSPSYWYLFLLVHRDGNFSFLFLLRLLKNPLIDVISYFCSLSAGVCVLLARLIGHAG